MRIGINVPNELLERVKQVKPEVNVSQVCREALELRVELAQRAAALAANNGVDELVAQLDQSVEKPMIEPDWEAHGFDDARDWIKHVKPADWEQFIHQCESLRKNGRDEAELVDVWSTSDEVRGLNGRLLEHKEWFIAQYDLHFEFGGDVDLHEKARKEYSRAWLAYIWVVRRKLEKLRKEEYNKVMAEREADRRSRPEPEVPIRLT